MQVFLICSPSSWNYPCEARKGQASQDGTKDIDMNDRNTTTETTTTTTNRNARSGRPRRIYGFYPRTGVRAGARHGTDVCAWGGNPCANPC